MGAFSFNCTISFRIAEDKGLVDACITGLRTGNSRTPDRHQHIALESLTTTSLTSKGRQTAHDARRPVYCGSYGIKQLAVSKLAMGDL